MELRHLSTFKVVAEVKGFTRAAEVLGYAQSSITAQIQSLEQELGVPLFNRLGKRIVLTEAGERLLPFVTEMQKLLEQAKSAVSEGHLPQGTLVISAPETLCAFRLPLLLQEYRRRFPQVKIVLRPGLCSEQRERLRTGEIDIAFLMDQVIEMPDLHVESLLAERILLVASPAHPLAKKKTVSPHDLRDETVLLTESGSSYRLTLEQELQQSGVHLDQPIEFGSLEAIKQCALSGLGIAQLPEVVVRQELQDGRLTLLPWSGPEHRVDTQFAYHRHKWMSPAMQEFVQLTRTFFQQQQEKPPLT